MNFFDDCGLGDLFLNVVIVFLGVEFFCIVCEFVLKDDRGVSLCKVYVLMMEML